MLVWSQLDAPTGRIWWRGCLALVCGSVLSVMALNWTSPKKRGWCSLKEMPLSSSRPSATPKLYTQPTSLQRIFPWMWVKSPFRNILEGGNTFVLLLVFSFVVGRDLGGGWKRGCLLSSLRDCFCLVLTVTRHRIRPHTKARPKRPVVCSAFRVFSSIVFCFRQHLTLL